MTAQFSIKDNTPWKKRFFTIWTMQAISLLSSQIVRFAMVWFITIQTKSATALALATLTALLPGAILGPFIGSLVDRWDRRKIMILADIFIALIIASLAVLFYFDRIEIWHIYLAGFIGSIGGTFHSTAMTASTSLMVPKEHMTRIQGINQTLNGGLGIISAPLGALLVETLPMQGVLAIDVFTALIAITPLFFFAIPQPIRRQLANTDKTSLWQDTKEGISYVTTWPGMFLLISMLMVINFFLSPVTSFEPLLVTDHFGLGAKELGWLSAASGISVIFGGILLGVWGGFKNKAATSFFGMIGLGAGIFVLGFAPANAFWLALVAVALSGFMQPIVNGAILAILQTTATPEMQGRVFSVLRSGSMLMLPLGLGIIGPLSDVIGIRVPFMIGGLVCATMGIISFFVPSLMRIETDGVMKRITHEEKIAFGDELLALDNEGNSSIP